ncbi:MAG: ribonuclease HII [Candidatus Woesearchaeota archaeon]
MKHIAGIDEAGRGPVVGPLVLAGVMVQEKDIPLLERMGVKDSKVLTPARRETLYDAIVSAKFLKHHIISLSPKEIDEALASPNLNLNTLEGLHSAMIINKLQPSTVILDLPSNNAEAYNAFVRMNLIKQCEIISEHKADAKYAVVSAASILAKVTRDRAITAIKEKININLGSGYPSDPVTVAFLKKYYNHAQYNVYFRKSWQSYKKLVTKSAQKSLRGF